MQKIIMSSDHKSVSVVYDIDKDVYLVLSHGPNDQIDVNERTPEYVARYLLRCSVSAYDSGNIIAGDELSEHARQIIDRNNIDISGMLKDVHASYEAYRRACPIAEGIII